MIRFIRVENSITSRPIFGRNEPTECNSRDLEWPRRGYRIVNDLLANQADIICLQEVEHQHLESLYRPKLCRFGYGCLYKKKTGRHTIDGCAIFYKRSLFHLLNYKGVEFNRCDITNLLNRDNIGIIAVLRPKFGHNVDQQLVVANTHLLFNPRRSEIKLAQLKLFLSELDNVAANVSGTGQHEHHPTILCGDMNSVPESELIAYVMSNDPSRRRLDERNRRHPGVFRGQEDDDWICSAVTMSPTTKEARIRQETEDPQRDSDLDTETKSNHSKDNEDTSDDIRILRYRILQHHSHKFKFRSVYSTHNRQGQPLVSTFSSCIVDYIFYTPKLQLESYRELFTENQLRKIEPIPNAQFPSDHFSLFANFSLS